jgi:hypothetical protein
VRFDEAAPAPAAGDWRLSIRLSLLGFGVGLRLLLGVCDAPNGGGDLSERERERGTAPEAELEMDDRRGMLGIAGEVPSGVCDAGERAFDGDGDGMGTPGAGMLVLWDV